MFIENLRHVKKKWKIPMLIGVGLILIGLMGSYAYFGSSYDGISAGGTGVEGRIKALEENIKTLEKSVKGDPDNSALVVELADGYFDLASYQLLILKESAAKESFMSAATHYQKAAQLFTGETEETAWVNLYSRWIGSNIQIGDINGAKKTFEGSLEPLPYNIDVLKAYGDQMIQAEQEDALISHLNAFLAEVPETEEEYRTQVGTILSTAQFYLMSRIEEESAAPDDADAATDSSGDETEEKE